MLGGERGLVLSVKENRKSATRSLRHVMVIPVDLPHENIDLNVWRILKRTANKWGVYQKWLRGVEAWSCGADFCCVFRATLVLFPSAPDLKAFLGLRFWYWNRLFVYNFVDLCSLSSFYFNSAIDLIWAIFVVIVGGGGVTARTANCMKAIFVCLSNDFI